MVDKGTGSCAFLIPPFHPVWVRGLFRLEVLLVGSVDGTVKGFQASPQPGFHLGQLSVVKDVL